MRSHDGEHGLLTSCSPGAVMPERRKLTKEVIARLKLPDGTAETTVWDATLPGFGVRLRAGGSRTFICKFRIGGRSRQIVIGPASPDGLASARMTAAKTLQDARAGHDPQAARQRRHQEARETLGDLIETYLARATGHLRPKTVGEVTRYLRVAWKPLHDRPARSVTRGEVARRLDDLAETSGRVTANRARTVLSAVYAWAIARDRADTNPVTGTKPHEEWSRDRVLADAELRAIWRAADGEREEYGRIVQLLLLTGCRRQEVGSMRWSELSPDLTTWTIPASRTKNGAAHVVTLAPLAWTILEDQPQRQNVATGKLRDAVFGDGMTGYSGWTRAKRRLDARIVRMTAQAAGRVEPTEADQPLPWTLHDLRRTFATVCAERLGIAPHVIEACLNHVEKRRDGVAGIYNRATYAEPMAQAWKAYAAWVTELVTGEEGTKNLVVLRR